MNIDKKNENGITTLYLDGRLDTTTSTQFQDILIPTIGETDTIVLNCEKLVYISSAGLRILLIGQKAAKAKKASLTLCNVSESILEVFEMTGFSSLVKLV